MDNPIVQGWQCPLCKKIYSPFIPSCNCADTLKKNTAYWKIWAGWVNHYDLRIDDATCSNCGYVHPTVRGATRCDSLTKLSQICPQCGLKISIM